MTNGKVKPGPSVMLRAHERNPRYRPPLASPGQSRFAAAMTADSYRAIPIAECGEPLVEIPAAPFACVDPPPYVALGAPYGGASPWQLRRRVLDALLAAAQHLSARQPGWRLKLFDAYRPVSVQA